MGSKRKGRKVIFKQATRKQLKRVIRKKKIPY